MTWYVVCHRLAEDPQPDDEIWTLSRDPDQPGWNTDCGFPGYGLTKADAQELAEAANAFAIMLERTEASIRHERQLKKKIRNLGQKLGTGAKDRS